MVVKLDIRLSGKETREERESGYKHLLLFAAVFLFAIASTLVFVLGAWQLYSLRSQRTDLRDVALSNAQKISVMDKELSRISGETSQFELKLDYLLSDIPSIELLTAFAAIMPDTITVESLSLTTSKLSITGIGKNEEDILQFANDLNTTSFASSVSVPVISPATRNGVNMRTFKLECVLFPLDQIILRSNINQIKKSNAVSEDIVI